VAGCAQITPDRDNQREAAEQVSRIDKHSSFPAVRRIFFEQVNFVEMIDPHGRATQTESWQASAKSANDDERKWGVRYDLVLAWFRETKEMNNAAKVRQRNAVQDKILGVTQSRCNVFKTYLRRQQSDIGFALGSVTTIAGVLGAVLPGATASRNLAGAAGIFSGLQAEYNASYYSNLTAHVIVQGIELRQNRLKKDLIESRRNLSINDYSMEAAINDAVIIDGTCSTVVGLIEAGESIREVGNPGFTRAIEMMAGVKAAGAIAQSDNILELMDSGRLSRLLKQTQISTSPLIAALGPRRDGSAREVHDALFHASQAGDRIDELVALGGFQARQAFEFAQAKFGDEKKSKVKKDDVAERFAGSMKDALKQLDIQACTKIVIEPGKALAGAVAALDLMPPDSTQRAAAEVELAKAKSDSLAAAAKVEKAVAAADVYINAEKLKWRNAVGQEAFDMAALDQIAKGVSGLSNEQKALCK